MKPLLLLSVLLGGCASSTQSDAFRVGSARAMTNVETGALTQWKVTGYPAGTTFGCYTSVKDNEFRDLYISKTDPATYWNPGVPENVHVILRESEWGPYIFELRITEGEQVVETVYYESPPGKPADLQIGEAGTSYTAQFQHTIDEADTQRCPETPTAYAGTWTSTWSNQNGMLCGLYNETSTTDPTYTERWCYDPKTLDLLEVDALTEAGVPTSIMLKREPF